MRVAKIQFCMNEYIVNICAEDLCIQILERKIDINLFFDLSVLLHGATSLFLDLNATIIINWIKASM